MRETGSARTGCMLWFKERFDPKNTITKYILCG